MRLTFDDSPASCSRPSPLVAVAIPRDGYAAAPNVRIVTPAGIAIDGSNGDWDNQSADFLSDMYTAGKPDKPVLAKSMALRLRDEDVATCTS